MATSKLLKLPAEIRNPIFRDVLTAPPISILQCDSTTNLDRGRLTAYATTLPGPAGKRASPDTIREFNQLKYVCRQLYTETVNLELQFNELYITRFNEFNGQSSPGGQLYKILHTLPPATLKYGVTFVLNDYLCLPPFCLEFGGSGYLNGLNEDPRLLASLADLCNQHPYITVKYLILCQSLPYFLVQHVSDVGFALNVLTLILRETNGHFETFRWAVEQSLGNRLAIELLRWKGDMGKSDWEAKNLKFYVGITGEGAQRDRDWILEEIEAEISWCQRFPPSRNIDFYLRFRDSLLEAVEQGF
ncbi:hypothetical protein P154DRAFT_596469 [Amniculicola lignicola CBS 123094]|uniref:Uncharacterized protein n=1 Tax=Amniculicola lignicola CBS 123094 TaxID=1392246 RepID=A0A6A5WHG5_9PLEO|nr:hypothetical protein P154DRAFT_596469 [Amniculicola lignicola CBS 123094]